MKVEKILVPVDGSDHSMRAAEYAAELAIRLSAEIILLYCHKAFPVTLGEPYFQQAIDKITKKANSRLDPFRRLLKDKAVPFSDRIMEGPARETIINVAVIEKLDMVIMGSRGLSDLEGLVLGSVTHRVLRSAPCPVLVIR